MRNMLRVTLSLLMSILVLGAASAEDRKADVFGEFEGAPMYTVLEPGDIPAIENPQFVSGDAADAQMLPEEPVIGIVLNGQARAYSMWQLDHHEIVDDVLAGIPIAVNW